MCGSHLKEVLQVNMLHICVEISYQTGHKCTCEIRARWSDGVC